VTDVPDLLDLPRHRDLLVLGRRIWYRRVLLGLLAVFLLLGVANVFGQRPAGTVVSSPAARMELYAPTRVRSGVLYEARFTIVAHREIGRALLMLSPGWNEGQQLNTIEPVPFGQSSRNGDLLLTLGHIAKGATYRIFFEFQVNPTNVAFGRTTDVALYDRGTRLLSIHRSLTVYP
jgi:hypothetical protein